MPLSNRQLIEKADLALSDLAAANGILKPAHAKKFLRLVIKESVLLKMVTVVPMAAPKHPFSQAKIGSRVLRAGRESTALGAAERVKPDFTSVELDAKLCKGEIRLSDEQLEDNIEQGQFRQTVMSMMAAAVARDIEELIILGDTASADPFLSILDGVLKQATSNIVDAAGAPLNKDLLTDMLKTMPKRYVKNKRSMRFFSSLDADFDYRNQLANRTTAVGDRVLEEDVPIIHSGVPIVPIPLFPEDLGTTGDQTTVLLTPPKNILVGFWRRVRFETGRDISEGTFKVVCTLRADTKYQEEQAVVRAINVLN